MRKLTKRMFALTILALISLLITGCNHKKKKDDVKKEISISFIMEKDTITIDESVKLTVTINNATDKSYRWVISDSSLLSINNDVLTVIASLDTLKIDKTVNITVVSNEDDTKKMTKTIKVKAPTIQGEVGELTSDMIEELGNASITVKGSLKDVYKDFYQSTNNNESSYDILVKMEENKWYGEWNSSLNKTNVIVDNYRRSTLDDIKDEEGNIGHGLEKVFINKNNELEHKLVTDYLSVPALWENQHLWNHISNLNINKFSYIEEAKMYEYLYDINNIDDLYLMTYLSYSLTPILSDTLDKLYLVVEDGKISKLKARTEIRYFGSDTEEDADGMSYTTIELEFSNIGTTVVNDPTPYDAPLHSDKILQAINNIKNKQNYTFKAVDTTTYAPSANEDDYAFNTKSINGAKRVHNHVSSIGTVGTIGQITKEAALFANTIKYSASMDDKIYRTEYTGYKQNNNNTYDEFAYNTKTNALYGTRNCSGSIFDVLPGFEFSPNIFRFEGDQITNNGQKLYVFTLNETSIMRDVAMEISAHNYAEDAEAQSTTSFRIIIDEFGNLVSSVFPYSVTSGTYLGYITTTYLEVGTTTLEENLFDNYIPRVVRTTWDEYSLKDYSPTFSVQNQQTVSVSYALNTMFSDAQVKNVPSPNLFLEVFGDSINTFYDWKEVDTDKDGNKINHGFIEMTASSREVDENGIISNYEELMSELKTNLFDAGFKLDNANSDITSSSRRIVAFVKGEVMIVIENNYSRFFWISIYKVGDWSLN